MSPLQKARLALRVLTGDTKVKEQYLLQWESTKWGHSDWVLVERQTFKTPELAQRAALDGRTTPIPPNCRWRIVKETRTREVVA